MEVEAACCSCLCNLTEQNVNLSSDVECSDLCLTRLAEPENACLTDCESACRRYARHWSEGGLFMYQLHALSTDNTFRLRFISTESRYTLLYTIYYKLIIANSQRRIFLTLENVSHDRVHRL